MISNVVRPVFSSVARASSTVGPMAAASSKAGMTRETLIDSSGMSLPPQTQARQAEQGQPPIAPALTMLRPHLLDHRGLEPLAHCVRRRRPASHLLEGPSQPMCDGCVEAGLFPFEHRGRKIRGLAPLKQVLLAKSLHFQVRG